MDIVAIVATRDIKERGRALYVEGSRLAETIGLLSLLVKRGIGNIKSAPLELDLQKVSAKQAAVKARWLMIRV